MSYFNTSMGIPRWNFLFFFFTISPVSVTFYFRKKQKKIWSKYANIVTWIQYNWWIQGSLQYYSLWSRVYLKYYFFFKLKKMPCNLGRACMLQWSSRRYILLNINFCFINHNIHSCFLYMSTTTHVIPIFSLVLFPKFRVKLFFIPKFCGGRL